jgi:hypothetical protein
VHHRLGAFIGAARPPLDQVAGHGERRAGEGQERDRDRQFGDQQGDGVDHVGDVVLGQRAQPGQIGLGAQRVLGHRPGARGDIDAEADGVGRHDDVAVQHGGVHPVAAHRLEGDLGSQGGLLDGVEDAARAAHRPVFGEAAARLAHEPHRGVGGGPAGRSVEQGDRGHAAQNATGGFSTVGS